MPAISISTGTRRTAQTRYVVGVSAPEMTAAELWERALAGDAQARIRLLTQIMPRTRG